MMSETFRGATFVVALLCTIISLVSAAFAEKKTDLNANGAFADFVTVRTSYYRALCEANPLAWDQSLADKANQTIWGCDWQYDYWSPEGQIIFRMIGEGDSIVNSPKALDFAINHWYDMRVNYTGIESDEYDELQPFYPAWEFTQMVWKANTKVGCAYAVAAECPDIDSSPNDKVYQLYCLFSPGGNKWDQWGANVACKDCKGVEPQTATVDTATLTFSTKKRAVGPTTTSQSRVDESPHKLVSESWQAAMERVDKYLDMSESEFSARWDVAEPAFAPASIP